MGVYDPLHKHLKRQRAPEVTLSFDDIEHIIKRMLPNSAARPEWWEDPTERRTVQQNSWKDAGYNAFLLEGQDKVRFVRA